MIEVTLKTKYLPENKYIIEAKHYIDGNVPAIIINDKRGQQQIKASVNLYPEVPRKDCVFIKDWNENEGICDALMKADLIGVALKHSTTGYVVATEHAMRGKLLEAWNEYKKLQNL